MYRPYLTPSNTSTTTTVTSSTYEQIIYNSTQSQIFDFNKFISVLELNTTLNSDIIIQLENLNTSGYEKFIIMGASVNKYINGYKIILSSIFVNQNGDGPDNMYMEFTHTGQYVKLLSFINKTYQSYGYKNKYWQILTGSYSLYSFNDANYTFNHLF